MTSINISRIHYPVTTLGPGERVGIWFQGCSIRCAGCISVDTWAINKGRASIDEVVEFILPWLNDADGVTITGGEPFDQPNSLITLLKRIHEIFKGDIVLYTGYEYEEIQHRIKDAEGLIDILICGPYDKDREQTLPLRGSDNQELHLLSSKGKRAFENYINQYNHKSSSLDVMFDLDGTVWFAGIPRQGDFTRLRSALERNGHKIHISDQRQISKEGK